MQEISHFLLYSTQKIFDSRGLLHLVEGYKVEKNVFRYMLTNICISGILNLKNVYRFEVIRVVNFKVRSSEMLPDIVR